MTDGLTFYLQDTSDGRPLIAEHTLASVVVHAVRPARSAATRKGPGARAGAGVKA